MIIKTYMVPHPPIAIPEIGKGEETNVLRLYIPFRRSQRK